jgi:hypothetical protein
MELHVPAEDETNFAALVVGLMTGNGMDARDGWEW